jgi:hypothetical protein
MASDRSAVQPRRAASRLQYLVDNLPSCRKMWLPLETESDNMLFL